MTVSAQPPISRSTGNGVTTVFPYTFKIISDGDIEVSVDDVVKTLNVDYTVSGAGLDAGGDVTMTTAPAVGTTVVRRRDMAIVRSTDYQDQGTLPAATLDLDIDSTVLMMQQLDERLGRTFSLPASSAAGGTMPTPAAGYVLGWDALGKNLTNLPASTGTSLIDLAASSGSSLIGFIQSGTGSVSSTVQTKLRESVSVKDFGAVGDGVTNDTAAIQAAATAAAGKKLYFPASSSSYVINSAINISSNTTVYGDGPGSSIKLGTNNTNGFLVDAKTGVVIRDLLITTALTGTLAYVGGVNINNSQKCSVVNVEFINMFWSGVLIKNSSKCAVQGCKFSGWTTLTQDSADITIYENANFNDISGNFCYGGGDHGILVQDPYTNTTPLGNIIDGNVVGQHNAYGIAVYIALGTTNPYDTRTVVSNNVVSDIYGTSVAGTSGAGIYIQAGGGAVVTGNTVYNCCRSTANFDTLAVAGISVQVGETGSGLEVEIVVSNNHVHALRGPCIWAAASNRSISIIGNTLKSTGITAVRGEAIIVSNSKCSMVANNVIRHQNSNYSAVRFSSGTNDYSYHNISNNIVTCVGSGGGFDLNTSTGGTMSNVCMTGNSVFGSISSIAYNLGSVSYLKFIGNYGESSGIVFYMSSCLGARLSCNRLISNSGTFSIYFVGTNTGAVVDETNDLSGIIQNDASNGTIISQFGTISPATGTWSFGDRIIARSPTVGTPKGWRCTVSGTNGTWVSEGNL